MAKRPALEDRLAELGELRDEPDSAVVVRELRRGLKSRRAPLAAKAAKLAGELGVAELADQMVAAFERCLVDPLKSDKGCIVKIAVARALLGLEESRIGLFRAGARHVQLEPSWGPPVDTAAELRGVCAHGLIDSGWPGAVLEVVRLLTDSLWNVRAEAARALGGASRLEAEPVLRLKALLGDEEPDVLSECLGSLLSLGESSLEFVAGYLEARDAVVAQAAALALGESRLEGAVEPLREAYRKCVDSQLRRALLLSLAMTRREPALDFLFEVVSEAPPDRAAEALKALAVHRHDPRVRERAEKVLSEREDRELWSVYQRECGPGH